MYYAVNSDREVCREVYLRQRKERAVISAFVRTALKAGYSLAVHDGQELHPRTADYKRVMSALFSADEEHVYVYDAGGTRVGWVHLVHGNDGWDVINDCSSRLDSLGLMTKAGEVSDRLS